MVVIYAFVSVTAAIATALVAWPLGVLTALAAAPFGASLAVLVVASAVCLRPASRGPVRYTWVARSPYRRASGR